MHEFKTISNKLFTPQAGTGGPGTGETGLGPLTIESSGGDSRQTFHGPFSGGGSPIGDQVNHAHEIPHKVEKGQLGHN